MELDAYRQMAATEDGHWWFCGRRAIAEAVIRSLKLPAGAKVLEIGAGTGGNIAMLEKFGAVTAVEMNELARSIAREKTGRELLSGYLPDALPLDDQAFDLVCLFDVLEHVAEDEASLKAIHRLVRPGGCAVVTVPAHQWLWSRHDTGLHHMRRYSRATLRARLTDADFIVEKLTYTNAALFPLAVMARLADRLRSSKAASGQKMPPKPVNAAMKAIFSAERHLVRTLPLPFGVSLLAVLRRAREAAAEPSFPGALAA